MWQDIKPAPADPILGLTEAFTKDPRKNKVNLGVGVFKDEHGLTPIFRAVKTAEQRLIDEETTKSYMPIAGDASYAIHVQTLLFGTPCERAFTVHTPGGTGALRVAGELLNDFSNKTIWVSSPTWANHKNVFSASGLAIKEYPYYNPETKALDESAFFDTLCSVKKGDVVLLHACCHNPTGVDLHKEQWEKVAKIANENGWTAMIDFAYQGFGESVENDRVGVEVFLNKGIEFFVASSFSKNFGLYRERVGALTCIASDKSNVETISSHMKRTARVIYSNPPAHGSQIVTTILGDKELTSMWKEELDDIRGRIAQSRIALANGLDERDVDMDLSFITKQKGMFSFSGLNKSQVEFLKEKHAIYIVGSGRINVAGITPSNTDLICDAIAKAFKI